jgi:hypothetical protein
VKGLVICGAVPTRSESARRLDCYIGTSNAGFIKVARAMLSGLI